MNVFRWGSETVRSAAPTPFLQYEPRRRRLPELLLDATRWDSRVHLVHGQRRITFGAFQAAVAAAAGELRRPGGAPPDPGLLLAAHCPVWVVGFWGGLSAAAILAPGYGLWCEGVGRPS